jgi:hypothetical protein
VVHERRTQMSPVGPRMQSKPEGQGILAQRVGSQRRVCCSQVSPSGQPVTVQPG